MINNQKILQVAVMQWSKLIQMEILERINGGSWTREGGAKK